MIYHVYQPHLTQTQRQIVNDHGWGMETFSADERSMSAKDWDIVEHAKGYLNIAAALFVEGEADTSVRAAVPFYYHVADVVAHGLDDAFDIGNHRHIAKNFNSIREHTGDDLTEGGIRMKSVSVGDVLMEFSIDLHVTYAWVCCSLGWHKLDRRTIAYMQAKTVTHVVDHSKGEKA